MSARRRGIATDRGSANYCMFRFTGFFVGMLQARITVDNHLWLLPKLVAIVGIAEKNGTGQQRGFIYQTVKIIWNNLVFQDAALSARFSEYILTF